MQNTAFLHSDEFYHNLLSSFLESAKVNPNSFFELRIQNGSLRHKFTTTERPDPAGNRNYNSQNRMAFFRNTAPPVTRPLNQRASFHNIPAAQQHLPPPPKRRYTAIISPPPTNTASPTKTADTENALPPELSPEKLREPVHAQETDPDSEVEQSVVSPTKTANTENAPPLDLSPEKLREPVHAQETYSDSEDEQSVENIVSSTFYSPNRFACLAETAKPIVDKSSAGKSFTPNQNAVAKVQGEPEFPPPNPSLDLTIIDKKCRRCKDPLLSNGVRK